MKTKRNLVPLAIVLLIALLLTGCNSTSFLGSTNDAIAVDTVSKNLLASNLEKLLIKSTAMEFGEKAHNVQIADIYVEEKSYFVTYLFEKEKAQYLAILYAEKVSEEVYDLGLIDGFKAIDNKEPIGINNIVSETKSQKIKRRIHIVTGLVNNDNVDTVYISYPSGKVSGIKIGKNKTYTEVAIGLVGYPKSVKAVTKNDEILYEKNY
jgi:predicted small secreted protein